MSNDWFRFRKFLIKQDRCGMKVGTDAVLIGAWCDLNSCKRILDIGTGTGIIALMCAQRSNAMITGVEIDSLAAGQASENFQDSPWSERLKIVQGDIRDNMTGMNDFDMIISNPPYFKDSLQSKDPERNAARHEGSIDLKGLIDSATRLLSKKGRLNLILPYDRFLESESLFREAKLSLVRKASVSSRPGSKIFRVLSEWSPVEYETDNSHINIYNENSNNYHSDYISLTRNFYL